MSAMFPKWTNRLPLLVIFGLLLLGTATVAGVWYYFTPKYTDIGYEPIQPVAFPHSVHVSQMGMDCRYCHSTVEKSWYSNIPASSTCMNCHNQVLKDDARLALVRDSAQTGKPIQWIQIHRLPDFAYFNHSAHVNRGVSCVHCHGQINQMDEVRQVQPLSMAFCLDCHRDPAPNLRPLDKITALDWDPHQHLPKEWFQKAAQEWKVEKLQNCSACHR
jgi:hypothetical protein